MLSGVLVAWLLSAEPAPVKSDVACETVAQCWLDEKGAAIQRPKSKKGRPLPKPDCGKNILWLRYRLTCDEGVCASTYLGDAC